MSFAPWVAKALREIIIFPGQMTKRVMNRFPGGLVIG